MRSSEALASPSLSTLTIHFHWSKNGVANGTRTRNNQNHNLELYH